MPNDFLSRVHAHMFIIVPINQGACFLVCLLLLYLQRYLRCRLYVQYALIC